MAPITLLDANVLYPSLIRNLLMHCATRGLIAARWTAAIHEEWIRNLHADRPDLSLQRLHRTRRLMEQALPDADVTGYEHLIAELHLPDPDDAHVLAAAIHAEAEWLVTQNLRDFPAEELSRHGIQAVTSDDLMCLLLEHRPEEVQEAFEALRESLKSPSYTRAGLLERLRDVGLTTFGSTMN